VKSLEKCRPSRREGNSLYIRYVTRCGVRKFPESGFPTHHVSQEKAMWGWGEEREEHGRVGCLSFFPLFFRIFYKWNILSCTCPWMYPCFVCNCIYALYVTIFGYSPSFGPSLYLCSACNYTRSLYATILEFSLSWTLPLLYLYSVCNCTRALYTNVFRCSTILVCCT
jgi:hypothetical protein